jgi:hypothetical protein
MPLLTPPKSKATYTPPQRSLSLTHLIRKNPFQAVVLPERMSWTSSSMKLFRSCKRKWFWKYIMRLRPIQRDPNLMIGSFFHEVLGQWYRGKRSNIRPIARRYAKQLRNEVDQAGDFFDQNDLDKLRVMTNTFIGMMVGYERRYEHDKPTWRIDRGSIEYKFKVNMGNFDFEGKTDLTAYRKDIGHFVVEHKTASKIDENYIDRLPIDTQSRAYKFGLQRSRINIDVNHILYDVVKKCKLRRKSNESITEFSNRVADAYVTQPSSYFYREPLPFKPEDIDAFEFELHQTHHEYRQLTENRMKIPAMELAKKLGIDTPELDMKLLYPDPLNPRSWLANDSQCYNFFRQCEYLPLCTSGLNRGTGSHLRQVDYMHTELADVDPNEE